MILTLMKNEICRFFMKNKSLLIDEGKKFSLNFSRNFINILLLLNAKVENFEKFQFFPSSL
jgi:hypothetical protein